jgi:hypothetical protein
MGKGERERESLRPVPTRLSGVPSCLSPSCSVEIVKFLGKKKGKRGGSYRLVYSQT